MKSAEDGESSVQGCVAGCSSHLMMVVVELSPSGLLHICLSLTRSDFPLFTSRDFSQLLSRMQRVQRMGNLLCKRVLLDA